MSSDEKRQMMEEQKRMQEDRQMNVAAEKTSQQVAAESVSEVHRNPEFVDKLQDLGVSSKTFSWIEEELGVELAGGHIFGNRDSGYTESMDLLSRNTSAMAVAESNPGRILRENPLMLAVARGIHHRVEPDEDPLEELQDPATPKEKRALREASDLITNHKRMARGSTPSRRSRRSASSRRTTRLRARSRSPRCLSWGDHVCQKTIQLRAIRPTTANVRANLRPTVRTLSERLPRIQASLKILRNGISKSLRSMSSRMMKQKHRSMQRPTLRSQIEHKMLPAISASGAKHSEKRLATA
jgi:hypothetical protein